MIVQHETREVLTTGVGQTQGMSISSSAEAHIIKLITENAYKKPLDSGIRESVSNALDSHTEAGQTDPVIVSLKRNSANKWEFSVEDFGLGLDDVGFYKYIMGIGESTKQASKTLLGGLK